MVAKDYIYNIYKKPKHAINIYFRVLVWAIRVVSDKSPGKNTPTITRSLGDELVNCIKNMIKSSKAFLLNINNCLDDDNFNKTKTSLFTNFDTLKSRSEKMIYQNPKKENLNINDIDKLRKEKNVDFSLLSYLHLLQKECLKYSDAINYRIDWYIYKYNNNSYWKDSNKKYASAWNSFKDETLGSLLSQIKTYINWCSNFYDYYIDGINTSVISVIEKTNNLREEIIPILEDIKNKKELLLESKVKYDSLVKQKEEGSDILDIDNQIAKYAKQFNCINNEIERSTKKKK